jgi:hypothetical protein
MPVQLYLQVIGLTTQIEGIEEAAANHVTIEQLNDDIRRQIFSAVKFSSKLNGLLMFLKQLKLLTTFEHTTKMKLELVARNFFFSFFHSYVFYL